MKESTTKLLKKVNDICEEGTIWKVFFGLFAALLAADLLNIHIGVKQLTNKPVTAVSRPSRYPQRAAVRRIIEEELESVWEDRKPSKLALDTAVARSRALD